MKIGFSTGCLYKTHDPLAAETFAVFGKMGCNAIEIAWNVGGFDELEKIAKIKPEDLAGFEYVSIHATSFDDFNETEIVAMLQKLTEINDKLKFKAVVLHPYETMNWDIFRQFDLPFMIENMDWRKDFGKYVDSLEDIFSKFNAPMVLDLNHCYTNDPSMRLAQDMVETFGGRIEEIHLSGFETFHEPLFKTKQTEILQAIPDKRLPIIIESGCENVEEAKKEFEYVKNFLLA